MVRTDPLRDSGDVDDDHDAPRVGSIVREAQTARGKLAPKPRAPRRSAPQPRDMHGVMKKLMTKTNANIIQRQDTVSVLAGLLLAVLENIMEELRRDQQEHDRKTISLSDVHRAIQAAVPDPTMSNFMIQYSEARLALYKKSVAVSRGVSVEDVNMDQNDEDDEDDEDEEEEDDEEEQEQDQEQEDEQQEAENEEQQDDDDDAQQEQDDE